MEIALNFRNLELEAAFDKFERDKAVNRLTVALVKKLRIGYDPLIAMTLNRQAFRKAEDAVAHFVREETKTMPVSSLDGCFHVLERRLVERLGELVSCS